MTMYVFGGSVPSSAECDAQTSRRLLALLDCHPECRGGRLLILLASREARGQSNAKRGRRPAQVVHVHGRVPEH